MGLDQLIAIRYSGLRLLKRNPKKKNKLTKKKPKKPHQPQTHPPPNTPYTP